MRVCCNVNNRTFEFNFVKKGNWNEGIKNDLVFSVQKLASCTVCCLGRPILNAYHRENLNPNLIGLIVDPCLISDTGLDLYD